MSWVDCILVRALVKFGKVAGSDNCVEEFILGPRKFEEYVSTTVTGPSWLTCACIEWMMMSQASSSEEWEKLVKCAGTQNLNVSDDLNESLARPAFGKHRENMWGTRVPFSTFCSSVETKIAPVMTYSIKY